MDRNAPLYADLPLPELLRQLSTDTALLVRQEVALGRAELAQSANRARAAGGGFGVAAVAGLGAFGAFTAFAIALLALVLPMWAAALVVTIVYVAIAVVGALVGKQKLVAATPPAPHVVASVRDDAEAIRAGVSRGR